jgi:hypothetical protein
MSRDDSGRSCRIISSSRSSEEPVATIDATGVGQLVEIAVKGRGARPNLKSASAASTAATVVDPLREGRTDYVSCSPARVPVARPAAQALAVKVED